MKISKDVCCTGSAHHNFDLLSNRPFQLKTYGNGWGSPSVGGSRPCFREAVHCRYKHQEVAFLPISRNFFTPPPINGNTNPLVKTRNIGLAYWYIDGDRSSFESIY